jgi:hypothetical protein
MSNTDTPRTDAFFNRTDIEWDDEVLFARQLERELAHSLVNHFKTQAEVERLHMENVCLQELVQEFYEWSRRDYPTEAEVREIMDRYYNLLNHNSNNKPS